jgi:hypothetical protein
MLHLYRASTATAAEGVGEPLARESIAMKQAGLQVKRKATKKRFISHQKIGGNLKKGLSI